MSKIGQSLIQGALEALEYAKGQTKGAKTYKVNVPEEVDVSLIRNNLHMSRQTPIKIVLTLSKMKNS